MQAVLGEQDVGQELRPGAPARDRVRRRRRLSDRFAGSARELLAHVLDHLPLARDQLQRLGHVLAQLVQNAAAAWAGRGRRIDHTLARQVLRQRPARRLASLERLHVDLGGCRRSGRQPRLGFRLRGILLHVGERELQLLEHGAAFRGLAEPFVPELGNRVLHLLDQELAGAHLSLGIARLGLRFQTRELRGDHHRLERRDIVGERISSGRHNAIAAQIANVASPNRALIYNVASNNSARCLRPPRPLRHAPVDPFQQISQLRRCDCHRPVRRRRPDEAAALQPLGVKAHALAIVPQHLDQAATPPAEHEQMAAVRIMPEASPAPAAPSRRSPCACRCDPSPATPAHRPGAGSSPLPGQASNRRR